MIPILLVLSLFFFVLVQYCSGAVISWFSDKSATDIASCVQSRSHAHLTYFGSMGVVTIPLHQDLCAQY